MFHGLKWTRDNLLVPNKIATGVKAEKWARINGWPSGWFEAPNLSRLERFSCDLVEGFKEHVKTNYRGTNSIGYLLAHRGRNCLPPTIAKGGTSELDPLRRPGLKPFFEMVEGKINAGKTITKDDILEAQQQVVLLQVVDEAGVYLRLYSHREDLFYFGKAESIANRSREHEGSGTSWLAKGWLFNTPDDIGPVEIGIHRMLREIYGVSRFRQSSRSNGLWVMPKPSLPFDVVSKLMETAYRPYYYGTAELANVTVGV